MEKRLLFLIFFFAATPALAQEIVNGADAAGRAGAGVALPENDSALFLNPAGASLTPVLATGLLYNFLPGDGHVFSLWAVDGTAPKVDGGIGATVHLKDGATLFEERSIASIPLGARSAIGITQTFLYRDDLQDGDRTFVSADAGLVLGLGKNFSLGATMTNIPSARAPDRRRMLGAGAALGLGPVLLTAEGGLDLTPGEPRNVLARGAVEWRKLGPLTLRGGYVFDSTGTENPGEFRHAAALGLTYHDERSTLDIAYEHPFTGEDSGRLTVSIRFFLPGMGAPPAPSAYTSQRQ